MENNWGAAQQQGLQGAPQYNGRVGRALGPPNESGRMAVEVDAGLGQLPRRHLHGSRSLRALLVKPANVHVRQLVSIHQPLGCIALPPPASLASC